MPQLSVRSIAFCRALARGACWMLALVGATVLTGWAFDVPFFKSLVPGWAAMKPNTALALLLAAGALWPLAAPEGLANSRRRLLARAAATGVALIGGLTLAQYTFDLNLGLDRLLFHEIAGADTLWPGRMSPLAAADFLLLGIALLLISGKRSPAVVWTAQLTSLLAAFGAFIALTGYLYGREALGHAPFFTSTALHTAAGLLILSVGVACARPDAGLMALFNSRSAGGIVLRRLLLPIVLLPVIINWLELEGERRGMFPSGFGWMLDAALTVVLVGMLVWFVARIVHEKDVAREMAEAELKRSEERYRQLIEMSPVAIIVKDQRRIEFANPAARALVGAKHADEMLGKSPFAFVHPESRAIFEKDFCRVLRDGTPLPRTEQRVLRLDGTELDIEFSASAVDYHGQRFAQVVATDITERKLSALALRESEERFRLIAETITEVFWMADVDGDRMVYISPAYEHIWGRSCRSLYENPRSFVDAIHPDDRALVLDSFEIRKQGKPFGHEYRVVQPNGNVRWIWDRGYPVRKSGGAVLHYVGVAQDITERKRIEEALRASVERLQLLARVTGDAVWDWDMVSDSTWWSEAFVEKFGYARGTVPSFSGWIEHVHPEDRERATKDFNDAAARNATAWSSEYRFRLADGSYGIIFDRVYGMCDESGKLVRMLGSMVDITELRRIEERAGLLAQAVESTNDLISITSVDDRFLFVNRAFLDAYGYTADEVLGRTPDMLAPRGENVAAAIRLATLAGKWSGELVNRRKDGTEFPVHLDTSPVRDAHGIVIALMGVAKDITERKRAEETLRRDARILAQLHDAVICTDLEGRITYWNQAATHLLGWTTEEAVGRLFLDQHPVGEHAERWQRFQRVLAGEVFQGERQSTRKDGSQVWVASHIETYRDVSGRPAGVISVARDITESKLAAEKLRVKQAHFQRVIEDIFRFVPEALMVFTRQMALFKENKALDDLVKSYATKLGYTEPELREALLKEICLRVLTDDHGQIRIPRKRRNEQGNHQPDDPGQSAGAAAPQIP